MLQDADLSFWLMPCKPSMNRALPMGVSPWLWTPRFFCRRDSVKPSAGSRVPGKEFYFTPSEATSLLITEVDPLMAISCRAEHKSRGLSPQLSNKDPGVFSSRNNGSLWLFKEL